MKSSFANFKKNVSVKSYVTKKGKLVKAHHKSIDIPSALMGGTIGALGVTAIALAARGRPSHSVDEVVEKVLTKIPKHSPSITEQEKTQLLDHLSKIANSKQDIHVNVAVPPKHSPDITSLVEKNLTTVPTESIASVASKQSGRPTNIKLPPLHNLDETISTSIIHSLPNHDVSSMTDNDIHSLLRSLNKETDPLNEWLDKANHAETLSLSTREAKNQFGTTSFNYHVRAINDTRNKLGLKPLTEKQITMGNLPSYKHFDDTNEYKTVKEKVIGHLSNVKQKKAKYVDEMTRRSTASFQRNAAETNWKDIIPDDFSSSYESMVFLSDINTNFRKYGAKDKKKRLGKLALTGAAGIATLGVLALAGKNEFTKSPEQLKKDKEIIEKAVNSIKNQKPPASVTEYFEHQQKEVDALKTMIDNHGQNKQPSYFGVPWSAKDMSLNDLRSERQKALIAQNHEAASELLKIQKGKKSRDILDRKLKLSTEAFAHAHNVGEYEGKLYRNMTYRPSSRRMMTPSQKEAQARTYKAISEHTKKKYGAKYQQNLNLIEFRKYGAKDKKKRIGKKSLIVAASGLTTLGIAGKLLHSKKKSTPKPIPSISVEEHPDIHLGMVVPADLAHKYQNHTHISGDDIHELLDRAAYYKADYAHVLDQHEKEMKLLKDHIPNSRTEVYMRVKLPHSAKVEVGRAVQIQHFLKKHIDPNIKHEVEKIKLLGNFSGLNHFHR